MKEGREKGGNKVGSKLGESHKCSFTQCSQETKVLGTNGGEKQAIGLEKEIVSAPMWPRHLNAIAHQDDLLRTTSQNLDSDIDAKLRELKLKGAGGEFEEELAQDTRSTSAVVEVEDMTSEDYYYDPFGHYAAHEEALKDESRMLIWQQVRR